LEGKRNWGIRGNLRGGRKRKRNWKREFKSQEGETGEKGKLNGKKICKKNKKFRIRKEQRELLQRKGSWERKINRNGRSHKESGEDWDNYREEVQQKGK